MSREYDSIMSMLEFEDMKRFECDDSSILALNTPKCCYKVSPNDIKFWVYEFEQLEPLNNSVDEAKKFPLIEDQSLDFAQNGLFLLIVQFKKNDEIIEDQADTILQAFAGYDVILSDE